MSAGSQATWRAAVAQVVVESGRTARLALRGTSMLPLLRERMALEVRAVGRGARVGDVLVFAQGESYVAHRVVGRRGVDYLTCGDAQPEITEQVAPAAVLGRVVAVWSDLSGDARRVDDWRHRLRGQWYGRGWRLRAALWTTLRRCKRRPI